MILGSNGRIGRKMAHFLATVAQRFAVAAGATHAGRVAGAALTRCLSRIPSPFRGPLAARRAPDFFPGLVPVPATSRDTAPRHSVRVGHLRFPAGGRGR